MKTVKEVLKQLKNNPVIVGFSSEQDVFEQFCFVQGKGKIKEKILLAYYDNGGYDGSASVFFYKEGKYYEVYGSHCSCFGLENQWKPEEVVLKELENRIEKGYFPGREVLQEMILK